MSNIKLAGAAWPFVGATLMESANIGTTARLIFRQSSACSRRRTIKGM